jgi:hypothetical protein
LKRHRGTLCPASPNLHRAWRVQRRSGIVRWRR